MKSRFGCALTLVLAACSDGGGGPAAPDAGSPMIDPVPTGGTTGRPVVTALPLLRHVHIHYSN